MPLLLVGLVLIHGTLYPADLAWGAGAGAFGVLGLMLLYRGLAGGAMAVVAPTTAVTAAVVPVGIGLVLDRAPGALALTGAGCAVLAIALVSMTGGGGRTDVTARLIGTALGAGLAFGLFFALLDQAHEDAGLWPLAGARVASLAAGALAALGSGVALRVTRDAVPLTVAAGVLDMAANALFLLAAQRGLLSIVAPIATLYPASTVLLAFVVDRERVRAVQVAGLFLAATALVLVAA